MATALEKVSGLIQAAATALAKAATAAEVLDVQRAAKQAYDEAKTHARLFAVKNAHDAVRAACHKVQADALVIEAQAQCRLADEYDAAQKRGEAQKAGGNRTSIIPDKNNAAKVTDIGLTSKQVHEARAIRDAEKAKPGVVRKTVDAQLKAGAEPTRTDVKRVVKEITNPNSTHPKNTGSKSNNKSTSAARRGGPRPERQKNPTNATQLAAFLVLDKGYTYEQAANETDVGSVQIVKTAVQREEGRREAMASPEVQEKILSMSAQEKFAAALRAAIRKLELEFEFKVREKLAEWLNAVSLPHYAKKLESLERLISSRKGVMDKITYNKIRFCLHPDHIQDPTLKKRHEEAFTTFNELEKLLLSEKESPTEFRKLPRTYEELMAMKAKVQAERKAKRSAGKVSVRQ